MIVKNVQLVVEEDQGIIITYAINVGKKNRGDTLERIILIKCNCGNKQQAIVRNNQFSGYRKCVYCPRWIKIKNNYKIIK